MAFTLNEYFFSVALDSFDITSYWDNLKTVQYSNLDKKDIDGEYPSILLLYETLLDDMLNKGLVKGENVKRAIEHLVNNHSHIANGQTPQDLDYNDLNNCFGYLHRYAACHTALVHTILKRVFHIKPPVAVRRLLCLKESLDIVSLGGGPGSDLVGFCSALYGKHYRISKLNLTIVDHMLGWKKIFLKTIDMLQRTNLGNASDLCQNVEIQPSFIEADVTNPTKWNPNLNLKIRNADVLLLVKVLSVIPDNRKNSSLQVKYFYSTLFHMINLYVLKLLISFNIHF